ncbi:MAG: hypothetical protein Q9160_001597 [Pyrenula sp. 1 TL-2023]
MGLFSRKKPNVDEPSNSLTKTSAYDAISAGPPPKIGDLPYKPSSQTREPESLNRKKANPGKSSKTHSPAVNGHIIPPAITQVNGQTRDLSRGRSDIPKPVNGNSPAHQPSKRFAKSTDSLSSVSPVRSERYFNILQSAITPAISKDEKLALYNEDITERTSAYSEAPRRRSLMEEVSSLDFTEKNLSEASSIASRPKTMYSFAQVYDVRREAGKSMSGLVPQKPPPFTAAEYRQLTQQPPPSSGDSAQQKNDQKHPPLQEVSEPESDQTPAMKQASQQLPAQGDVQTKKKVKEKKSVKIKQSLPEMEKSSLVPEMNIDGGREKVLRLSAMSIDDDPETQVYSEQPHVITERAESVKSTKSSKRKSFTPFSKSKSKSQVSLAESMVNPASRPISSHEVSRSVRGVLSDSPPRLVKGSPPRRARTSARRQTKPSSPNRRRHLSPRRPGRTHGFDSTDDSSDGPQAGLGDDPSAEEVAAKTDPVQTIRRTMAPANGYSRPQSEFISAVAPQRQLDRSSSNRSRAKSELIRGHELDASLRAMKRRSLTMTQPDHLDPERFGPGRASSFLIPSPLNVPEMRDSTDDTERFPLPPSNTSRKSSMKKKPRKEKQGREPQLAIRDFATNPPTVPKGMKTLRASRSLPSDKDERVSKAATRFPVKPIRNASPPPIRANTPNSANTISASRVGWVSLSTGDALTPSSNNRVHSSNHQSPATSYSSQSFSHYSNTLAIKPNIKTRRPHHQSLPASPSSPTPSFTSFPDTFTPATSAPSSPSKPKSHKKSPKGGRKRSSTTTSTTSSILNKDAPAYRRLEALKAELNLPAIPRKKYTDDHADGINGEGIPPVPRIPFVMRGNVGAHLQTRPMSEFQDRRGREIDIEMENEDERGHVEYVEGSGTHRRTKSLSSRSRSREDLLALAAENGRANRGDSRSGRTSPVLEKKMAIRPESGREGKVKVPRRKSSLSKRNVELGFGVEDLEWE